MKIHSCCCLFFFAFSEQHISCSFRSFSSSGAIKIRLHILSSANYSSFFQLVLLFWSCFCHEPTEHEVYIRTCCAQVFLYTHLVHLHYDATENINFYLPICAHERLAIFPYRNYRWKLPMFERKETSKRPWADKFFFEKNSESFRIFHESFKYFLWF